jgi:hypothetical protein
VYVYLFWGLVAVNVALVAAIAWSALVTGARVEVLFSGKDQEP